MVQFLLNTLSHLSILKHLDYHYPPDYLVDWYLPNLEVPLAQLRPEHQQVLQVPGAQCHLGFHMSQLDPGDQCHQWLQLVQSIQLHPELLEIQVFQSCQYRPVALLGPETQLLL